MSSTQRNNAFGNGVFGSSRPKASAIASTNMSGRPPVAPKGYVPPAMRQPTFDEMYPALGGKAAPVVKKTVLVEDTRPSLLKVLRHWSYQKLIKRLRNGKQIRFWITQQPPKFSDLPVRQRTHLRFCSIPF